jgi:uncharacterized RDD family membrane protein YckC
LSKNTGPIIDLSMNSDSHATKGSQKSFDYSGVRINRILAYIVDVVVIFFIGIAASTVAAILGIVTLGMLSPLLAMLLAAIPLAYHTMTIGSSWNATLGMRLFNLEVSLADGRSLDYFTAFIHSALFYFTMAITSALILLVSLFNSEGKLLHDYLTHSSVHNKPS